MWFELTGDERITRRCATENCGGQPTWRLEAGGVGADYCSGCREQIETLAKPFEPGAVYSPDADETTLLAHDGPIFWKHYGYGVELGYDMNTKRLIGVRIVDGDFTRPKWDR